MKSHVSDLLDLVDLVLTDLSTQRVICVSDRDRITIRSRVKSQGLSFLTITLPNFARDLERSLDEGRVDSKYFQYFRKYRSIPAFLRGPISQLFDVETGRMIDDVKNNPQCYSRIVYGIRQICLLFKKIRMPCTPKREKAALEAFVNTERDFNVFPLPREDEEKFFLVSRVLWDNIMAGISSHMFIPRHGPGATADRISGNQKYNWRGWNTRLEPYFPVLEYGYPATAGVLPEQDVAVQKLSFVNELDETPSRVVTVPKTLKSPRVIAIEPVCMQYVQHAVSDLLVTVLETSGYSKGQINFTDQTINQNLALAGSINGRLATIDLNEASDRVPLGYALYMFRSNPVLQRSIEACRSTSAVLPDGRKIPLRKFASMGSALCFPIEAMYFYTIYVVALLSNRELPVTARNVKRVSRSIFVYGDDIIVPQRDATAVLAHLRKYNCKVNLNKTFLNGSFRESCGVDGFGGEPVQPVYLTNLPPENRRQAKNLISWTAFAGSLYKRGLLLASQFAYEKVESFLGKLPWVSETSSMLGRIHAWPVKPKIRFNQFTQSLEVRGWVMRPIYRTDKLDGYGALMKSLLKLEALKDLSASRDTKHLERSALHDETALARRWVPAYNYAGSVH